MHRFLKTTAVVGTLFAAIAPAAAQQNPFVGIWSTTQARGNITAYVFFAPNGALEIVGEVTNGGAVSHICGTYKFNQTTVQIVFINYTPKVCGPVSCDPMEPINQPQTLGYQFVNPGQLLFSDASRYVRQAAAPPYLQPNNCTR